MQPELNIPRPYTITIPQANKREITEILKTTAAIMDAQMDLHSCSVDGDNVDLTISTDLDGWVIDDLLDAHLDGAKYSFFAAKGWQHLSGYLSVDDIASIKAQVAAMARTAYPIRAVAPNTGSPKQMPFPFSRGGKTK